MNRLLTYGVNRGELKHISEVANGRACNCVCSNCSEELVAKNNIANIKAHHFAHLSGAECAGAYETALHLLAKAVLAKTKRLFIPDFHYDFNPNNEVSLYTRGSEVSFDSVVLEQRVKVGDSFLIPDAIGSLRSRTIYIEFANSHFIDELKRKKLINKGIPCIEIDLSGQELDEEKLEAFFNSSTSQKYWIFNPRLEKAYQLEMAEKAKQEEAVKREELRKLNFFKANLGYKVLRVLGEVSTRCPKRVDALGGLKETIFYNRKELRYIIDGVFWNGKMFGFPPNGRYIYLNNEKVWVFPPHGESTEITEEQKKYNSFLYKGLMIIKEAIDAAEVGKCLDCQYSVCRLGIEEVEYQVCEYPK
ncbi:hypothetical protein EFA69_02620 [Rufibacter immobilis]|uniref:Competence protein CoiA n=1 Tax=Rufibacter immobilis TaxID=1348778 RepID=A0A3M9N3A9_9BACT|nr:hypothetical protein [Rufibacter immobilis]RNI32239.1 hypothetical protein EFA69_02620 [Rufibacter immobilis]